MNFQIDAMACSSEEEGGAPMGKKENILERLNRRNKDRQSHLDIKLEQRNKENVELEGTEFFAQTFAERSRDIEARIDSVVEMASSTPVAAGIKAELVRLFAVITVELQELQRYLTNSTMFLTDYKIKACQTVLNDLTLSSEAAHMRLLPKKKFGFSGKKITKKPLLNPKLSGGDVTHKTHAAAEDEKPAFVWTLSNRQHEHICLSAAEVNGQDITISNLQHCVVELQGHAGSLQLTHVSNCTFLCGPIARSAFAEHCQETHFVLACQQLRLHSSVRCRLFLHVTCRAIIEDCSEIQVGTYNYHYEGIEGDFVEAKLDRTLNNYKDVADFNWLSPDVPSPNWQLLSLGSAIDWATQIEYFNDRKSVAYNA